MKWIFRAASGFVFVIVSVILGWLVSIHEIDWLANLNENRHLSPQEYEEHSDWNSDVRAGRMERQYFEHHDEPLVHSSRCDACRLIASKFHHALELAEHKLGIRTHSFDEYEELADEDIDEVTRQVCSKNTFKYSIPIDLRCTERLAAPGLETLAFLPRNSESAVNQVQWPRRMKNHCNYMIQHLHGRDVYEMWLRTSVGVSDHLGRGFETFMCFGDGVFSDCVDRDHVFDNDGKIRWPGGDEAGEDEVEEFEDDAAGWELQANLLEQLSVAASSGAEKM